ncbi:putative protein OS=Streptomyces aurantiogriseus OX=66870 GN=GCM10010251_87300 PE=4 SV=1 [Streptomyces aurantiogriseus]|uniref:Uncharacterized protein n=2 Tax=Streptomyces aurantiogriseus TaxID=66870 RepID=A0A918FMN5_9ACTN|nr:hypothetical protein GCM10010251_87300 [Streptomyces aurantiogriseus]
MTARTTRGEGIRYRIDRPTFADIMRDLRALSRATTVSASSRRRRHRRHGAPRVRHAPQLGIDPSGTIVFRAHWSNRLEPLEEALRAVVAGRAPSPTNVGQTTRALTRMTAYADTALAAAGRGALRDFWRAAPPVAAMITLSRLFRSLPGERRVAPTVAITLALCAAAVSAGLLALQ